MLASLTEARVNQGFSIFISLSPFRSNTKICYPWPQKSEVSKDNNFPITGLPHAAIDFNNHWQQITQLKEYHEQQNFHLIKLPDIIADVVVAKLDERM